MASVHDVAAYILNRCGVMSAMKLQKLVYYSQAWSLVWDEQPLFDEPIEAWANGPVVRALYERHRGQFTVSSWDGDPSKLTEPQEETIEAVLSFYADRPAAWLSELTHMEDPWRKARGPLSPGTRSSAVITHGAMAEYYEQLVGADTAP